MSPRVKPGLCDDNPAECLGCGAMYPPDSPGRWTGWCLACFRLAPWGHLYAEHMQDHAGQWWWARCMEEGPSDQVPETSQPLVPDARTPEDPVFPACQYCDAPADYRCEAPLGTSPVAFCRVPLCEAHATVTEPQPGQVQVRCLLHRE
jgi:hypothetical protein